jgi:hypothetical protein
MSGRKIRFIRIVYADNGTIEAAPEAFNIIPDRLALSRALVADMANVVVAEVPSEAAAPPEHDGTYNAGMRDGYNACRAAILAQKEPKG